MAGNGYETEQKRLLQLWTDLDEDEHEQEGFIEPETGSDITTDDDESVQRQDQESNADSETDGQGEQTYEEDELGATSQEVEQEGNDEGSNTEQDDNEAHRGNYFKGKDGTKWFKNCANTRVRTRAENIISHLPGVKRIARDSKNPLDCWSLFIDNQMILDIAKYTSIKINQKATNYKDKYYYKETNEVEIKAVFGLLYLAGMFRANHRNLEDFWRIDGTGMDIFAATMSAKRFMFLLTCLRFDNIENRAERQAVDKLAPIRAVFDKFVNNCQQAYSPSEYLTLDEKLESFRGRCSFRQYIPNKPAKYGIKIQALVDSKTFYTLNMEVYTGKQPDGPFQLSNSPKDIALRMIEPISRSHRNVTFDNWYTSFELIQELFEKHKLTSVGTLRKNKRQIPPQLLLTRNRSEQSSLFGFQKNITIVSYIPKKGKNVLLLSSLHHDNSIDKDTGDKKLPEIISFYNSTKGGVDVTDELSASYNVARNSRRWPLTIMFCLLNTAGINSQIVYKFNTGDYKMKRRDYLKNLGLALVREHLQFRKDNPRLTRSLREKINNLTGEQSEEPPKKKQATARGRCSYCPRKVDRKTKYSCRSCEISICLEHVVMQCEGCANAQSACE